MLMYKKTSVATFSGRPKLQMDLCSSLNRMRNGGKYCDLDLVVNGKVYPIHKLVLAAASIFFDKMLSSNFLEKNSKSVDLSDVFSNGQTLTDILDYIYTGYIILNDDNYRDILNGASHLLIDDLRAKCSHFILVNLSPVNALQHWALAEMYSLETLAEICFQMVRTRFHDFLYFREDPLQMPLTNLKQLIIKDGMSFLYKFEKLKFLLIWLNADLENRRVAMRTLLEDETVIEKLGLIEMLNETRPDSDTIVEILGDLVNKAEAMIPRVGARTEALVGWHYKSSSQRSSKILTVCAYVPAINRWSSITKLRVDRQFGGLIGFIGRRIIYHCMNGFLVVDLDDYTYERIPLPSFGGTTRLLTHYLFLFEDKVFCLIQISKLTRHSLPNGLHIPYHEIKGILKMYNMDTKHWSKVCDIPIDIETDSIPLKFYAIQREDFSCCFIIGLSNLLSCQLRGPNDVWRINGPHLFMIKKKRTKYTLIKLEDPPIEEREDLHNQYLSMRIVGSKDSIFFYGTSFDGNQENESICGMMRYKIEEGQWEAMDDRIISFPRPIPISGFSGFNTTRFKLGIVAADSVQSLELGNIYQIQNHFPFVSQLWSASIETGEVRELAPPPFEKLKFFTACQVPFSVLDGASTHYSDRFEKRMKSPMSEGRLEGSEEWSCVLESKLEPVDSSSEASLSVSSTSTSSGSSSEVEILDVEN